MSDATSRECGSDCQYMTFSAQVAQTRPGQESSVDVPTLHILTDKQAVAAPGPVPHSERPPYSHLVAGMKFGHACYVPIDGLPQMKLDRARRGGTCSVTAGVYTDAVPHTSYIHYI